MIGTGGGPGLRLGWFLVVCGASGSGRGLAGSELLLLLLDTGLPRGRGHPVAAVHLDLLLGRP